MKWAKMSFLACFLMTAGYLQGTVCSQIGHAYELIMAPSWVFLTLILRLLPALGAVLVTAGLVAGLLRPVWMAFIAFFLSGLAMLLGWGMTLYNGILVAVYLLAGCLYVVGVAKELDERVRFSVRAIKEGQSMLLFVLLLVVCGSLYIGSTEKIEREGFSLPSFYSELFMEQMEKQIASQIPAEQRQKEMVKFREEFQRTIDEFFENTVKPYERFIPLAIAVSLLTSLLTITPLLTWIPTATLSIVFFLFARLGVTRVVSETREVERLTIA